MVVGLAVVSVGGVALDLVRFRVSWLNRQFLRWLAPLLKHDEGYRFTGATYMVVAALCTFALYGPEVAVPALLFLSVGDPVAAMAGRRVPGPRVFGKSPVGTAAFLAASLVMVGALVGGGANDYHWGLIAGALVAALVELLPLPPDDNVTIPLIAGAAMHFIGV